MVDGAPLGYGYFSPFYQELHGLLAMGVKIGTWGLKVLSEATPKHDHKGSEVYVPLDRVSSDRHKKCSSKNVGLMVSRT